MRFVTCFLVALAACGGKGAVTPDSTPGAASAAASSTPVTGDTGSAVATASSASPASSAAPADATPPEPIAGALPLDLGAKVPPFARRAVTPDKGSVIARGAVPVPEALASQIDATLPFFAWEQVMSPRVVLSFPKQAGLDLYILMFDGEVSIKGEDIAGKQKRLWRWNAARVPGLGAMVECKEPTRAIFVLVTNTPSTTLAQAGGVPAAKTGWTKRPNPVVSVELDRQPDLAWAGGAFHARLGFEDGSASLETLIASKNAPVPQHAHDTQWEILAVLSGEGTLSRASGGDAPVAAGTFASIPPGVLHSYKPAGTSPLVAVQLYLPPGPEQRFKKLAAGTH